MTTYERVTYRPEGARRSRTILLQDPAEATVMRATIFTGVEVNAEGDEVAPAGVDERRHVIQMDLVTRRTPMVMNRDHGVLEVAPPPVVAP